MTPGRERLAVLGGAAVAGAGAVLASTQPFASAVVAGSQQAVVVTGQQVAPALAPLGIVALALALALSIAGRVARPVLGVLLVLIGAGVVALSLPSVLDPAAGTAGAISAVTGVTDVAAVVRSRSGTAWPVAGVAAGVLGALLGLVVVVRARRWSGGGRRFQQDAAGAAARPTDPIAEWDALSKGTDPTAPGTDDGTR